MPYFDDHQITQAREYLAQAEQQPGGLNRVELWLRDALQELSEARSALAFPEPALLSAQRWWDTCAGLGVEELEPEDLIHLVRRDSEEARP